MILGVDPGLANTGWGIIDGATGKNNFVAAGVIRTVPADSHIRRLQKIIGELQTVAAKWRPQAACVERVFVNVNAKSTLALGEARGAALAALLAHGGGMDIVEMSALQIKKAVTGAGRADKRAVAEMVRRLLRMRAEDLPPPDACDALACALALTPLMRDAQISRLPAAARRGRRRR